MRRIIMILVLMLAVCFIPFSRAFAQEKKIRRRDFNGRKVLRSGCTGMAAVKPNLPNIGI